MRTFTLETGTRLEDACGLNKSCETGGDGFTISVRALFDLFCASFSLEPLDVELGEPEFENLSSDRLALPLKIRLDLFPEPGDSEFDKLGDFLGVLKAGDDDFVGVLKTGDNNFFGVLKTGDDDIFSGVFIFFNGVLDFEEVERRFDVLRGRSGFDLFTGKSVLLFSIILVVDRVCRRSSSVFESFCDPRIDDNVDAVSLFVDDCEDAALRSPLCRLIPDLNFRRSIFDGSLDNPDNNYIHSGF